MKVTLKVTTIAALAVTVALALATASVATHAAPPVPPTKTPAKPVTIKSGKSFEKCVVLNAAQTLEYDFNSSAKINFNLHYRKGDAIYYPVKEDRVNRIDSSYETSVREEFCLGWENKTNADVELTYSYRVRK